MHRGGPAVPAFLLAVASGCGGSVAGTTTTPADASVPADARALAETSGLADTGVSDGGATETPLWAAWPMLGQSPARQSRSLAPNSGSAHRSWDLALDTAVFGSCAIASDGTIYAATNGGNLYAISADGAVRWTGQTDVRSPAVGPDGTVYAMLQGTLVAYSPNGDVRWRSALGPNSFSSPAIDLDGTVYIATYDASPNGGLSAVSTDGSIRWQKGAPRYSSPAIALDGTVYAMQLDSFASYVDAFARDGSARFHAPLLDASFALDLYAVLGRDGSIYVPLASGIVAIGTDGTRQWKHPAAEVPPAVGVDGTIYVATPDTGAAGIEALGADGSVRWTYTMGGSAYVRAIAVGSDGNVYTGGDALRVVSSAGTLVRTIDVGGTIASAFAIDSDGTLLFGTEDGKVHAR
jgi:outer membrane protein assembly factor BamB